MKRGKKHKLLFYRHAMDKVWRSLLMFDIILWLIWYIAPLLPTFHPPKDRILFYSGIAIFVMMVIVFFIRNGAYVQARPEHLLLKIPLYSLKIPYGQINGLRTSEMGKVLESGRLRGSDRRFLKPYRRGTTVLSLILWEYPKSETALRLFFPSYMFLKDDKGFLIFIRDWMTLSTEYESLKTSGGPENAQMYTPQQSSKLEEDSPGLYNLFGE